MRHPILTATALVSALALTSLTGCQTLAGLFGSAIEQPEITIKGVRVTGLTLHAVSTELEVDIFNPNPVGLHLAGMDYIVNVEEMKFAEGTSKSALDLRAKESTPASLAVDFPLGHSGEAILDMLKKQELAYDLDLVFKMGTEDTHLKLPGAYSGVLPLPRPPVIRVRDFDVEGLSTERVEVKVQTTVENPNNFDIPLDEISANVWLNNNPILSNQRVEGLVLQKGQVTDVPLQFAVDFGAIGLVFQQFLQKPSLLWKVKLVFQSGQHGLPFVREGKVELATEELELGGERVVRIQTVGAQAPRMAAAPR